MSLVPIEPSQMPLSSSMGTATETEAEPEAGAGAGSTNCIPHLPLISAWLHPLKQSPRRIDAFVDVFPTIFLALKYKQI